MNKFFKSTVGKCFLYTLLCIFVFAVLILLGCFIAGNTNVFEWHEVGRTIIGVFGVLISVIAITVIENQ